MKTRHFLWVVLLVLNAGAEDRLQALRDEVTALESQRDLRRQDVQLRSSQTETALLEQAAVLIDVHAEIATAKDELAQARADVIIAQTELRAQRARTSQILTEAQNLAGQLSVQLAEIPGKSAAHRRVDAAVGSQIDITEATALLSLAHDLHQQAQLTTATSTTITDASGEAITVDLIAVSFAKFAYAGPDSVGVGIKSPADASGMRWQEQLSPANGGAIRSAAAALAAGRPAVVPMDITGTMRLETWDASQTLEEQIRAGGPLMIPLFAIAIVAALFMAERIVVFSVESGRPGRVDQALAACEVCNLDQAKSLLESTRGVASRLILAALHEQPAGQAAMEEAIEVRLLQETPRLRRRLGGIAVLAAIAPLLGLLGTVTGIIQTFAVIQSTGGTDVGLMAGGIAQALVTTATGLIIAIPTLICHRMLVGLLDRLVSAAECKAAIALTLLSREEKG